MIIIDITSSIDISNNESSSINIIVNGKQLTDVNTSTSSDVTTLSGIYKWYCYLCLSYVIIN